MIALNKVIVERADQHNISFNRHKTETAFAVGEVDFAGYRVNSSGYKPSPELTRAIAEFPRPTNRPDFLKRYNVTWGSSAPYHPQSNGPAEAVVKQMKKLIAGSKRGGRVDPDKLAEAMMIYRNAPQAGGEAPAEIVFNSLIRDGIPAHPRSFQPEWQRSGAQETDGGRTGEKRHQVQRHSTYADRATSRRPRPHSESEDKSMGHSSSSYRDRP